MVWRRPSVCLGLVDQTVSSRILQFGTFDQHDGRNMLFVFQDRRSKVNVRIVT